MKEQEIMQMAKEAGFSAGVRHIEDDVIRFATLVAEREREACAKVCESIYTNGDAAEGWLHIAADKIRARKENQQ